MSNRTVEAILRLSAKLGPMGAFGQLGNKLDQVNRKAVAFNRTQTAMARAQNAVNGVMTASAMRYLGPAAIGYGAITATREYAVFERQLTRTGLKIGATRKEMTDLGRDAFGIAQRYAVSNDAVIEAIDAYAETGAELRDIRSDIDGIVKAQQGMGASGADVVNTWDAARRSMGLLSKESERFFDIVAAGGASGKFEGSDLARYLPSLLPIAAANGFSGLSGSASIVGALEAMRNRVGTSEEAATSTKDFLEKINSPNVAANFKKLGVDLPKALKEAKRDGKDLFVTMARLIDKATHGDVDLLGHLFSEQDSRNFARMLVQDLPGLVKMIDELRNKSAGTIEVNVKAVTEDAEASIQHLSNSWEKFKLSIGQGLAGAGVPQLLDAGSQNQDRTSAVNARLTREGYTFPQRLAWWTRHSFDLEAQEEMARRQKTVDEYSKYGASRRDGAKTRETTFGAAIDANGLPVPVRPDANAASLPPRSVAEQYGLYGRGHAAAVSAGGFTPRDQPSLMDMAVAADELRRGGSDAGQSIAESAREINAQAQVGGSTFAAMLAGVGKQFGAEAAAAFNANVKLPNGTAVTVGRPVRADTGRSDAGRAMGPR
ncbi:MAG: phage tail tape measure protein [Mesorhizobium sp.]|nr:MAG: phage tail tape measure protein [Mesorhizobium sp.]